MKGRWTLFSVIDKKPAETKRIQAFEKCQTPKKAIQGQAVKGKGKKIPDMFAAEAHVTLVDDTGKVSKKIRM